MRSVVKAAKVSNNDIAYYLVTWLEDLLVGWFGWVGWGRGCDWLVGSLVWIDRRHHHHQPHYMSDMKQTLLIMSFQSSMSSAFPGNCFSVRFRRVQKVFPSSHNILRVFHYLTITVHFSSNCANYGAFLKSIFNN